jgi:hypothetical protein
LLSIYDVNVIIIVKHLDLFNARGKMLIVFENGIPKYWNGEKFVKKAVNTAVVADIRGKDVKALPSVHEISILTNQTEVGRMFVINRNKHLSEMSVLLYLSLNLLNLFHNQNQCKK